MLIQMIYYFFISFIDCKYLYPCIKDCYQFVVALVEKGNLINRVSIWLSVQCLSTLYIPHDQHIFIIDPSKRCQWGFIVGETQRLDEHFVKLQAVQHRFLLKVPDYDISLKTHEGLLPWSHILTTLWNSYYWYLIIMTPKDIKKW